MVASAAILKQAGYGLQFTTISEVGITSLIGNVAEDSAPCYTRGVD